jgi:hypothetical protein
MEYISAEWLGWFVLSIWIPSSIGVFIHYAVVYCIITKSWTPWREADWRDWYSVTVQSLLFPVGILVLAYIIRLIIQDWWQERK